MQNERAHVLKKNLGIKIIMVINRVTPVLVVICVARVLKNTEKFDLIDGPTEGEKHRSSM